MAGRVSLAWKRSRAAFGVLSAAGFWTQPLKPIGLLRCVQPARHGHAARAADLLARLTDAEKNVYRLLRDHLTRAGFLTLP